MTAPELLPCPFCGSAAKITEGDAIHTFHRSPGFYVGCRSCEAIMGCQCECDYGNSGDFKTPEAAAAAWNARAPLPAARDEPHLA